MNTRKSTNPYYSNVEEDKNGAEPNRVYDSPLQVAMPVTDFFYRTGSAQIGIDENPLSSRSNLTTSTARERM